MWRTLLMVRQLHNSMLPNIATRPFLVSCAGRSLLFLMWQFILLLPKLGCVSFPNFLKPGIYRGNTTFHLLKTSFVSSGRPLLSTSSSNAWYTRMHSTTGIQPMTPIVRSGCQLLILLALMLIGTPLEFPEA